MSRRRICEELECSESTAKRCIRDLRDRFNHPIEYDAERGGYHYGKASDIDGFELPGLWFTESELTALLTMKELLAEASVTYNASANRSENRTGMKESA